MGIQPPVHSMPVPALESGDRMSRAEFERRYAVPETVQTGWIGDFAPSSDLWSAVPANL